MNEISNRLLSILNKIFVLIAILIIVDFVWPGQVYREDILDIQRTREQYYNAARNSHVSFKVFTPNTSFHVSEAFAKSELKNQQIEYAISPIFKEVNWYQIVRADKKEQYSLRWFSGFILPLVFLLIAIITYQSKWNIEILLFILKVLLAGDLVFLII